MGLDEALDELDGTDSETFAERLQDEYPNHYKEIYSDGFGAGKTEVKSDLESTQSQLESLKEEREELQDQLEELKEEQPEAAELRGKYESKLQDKQQQIEQLQSQIDEVKSEKEQAIRAERERMLRERAKNQLVSQGVYPTAAEVHVKEAFQSDRVQFDDDLNPTVYEEDGVPAPKNGEAEPHEILAENIRNEIDPKFVEDDRPGSTGLGSTSSAGGGNSASWDDAKSGAVDPEDVLEGNTEITE